MVKTVEQPVEPVEEERVTWESLYQKWQNSDSAMSVFEWLSIYYHPPVKIK